jgi:hypothetical protein
MPLSWREPSDVAGPFTATLEVPGIPLEVQAMPYSIGK